MQGFFEGSGGSRRLRLVTVTSHNVHQDAAWSTSLATSSIMRKIPYIVALFPVVLSLVLSLVSFRLPEWVYAETNPDLILIGKVIRWGLYERCERTYVQIPGGKYESDLQCREFPSRKYDDCAKELDNHCLLWSTATYTSELSLIFLAATIVALLLVIGFGTQARRRTAWQGVVALMSLRGALQITTMTIVAHLHRTFANPMFHTRVRLGTSFYLSATSWVLDVFTIVALVYTASAAWAGERWAVGRGEYQIIPG